MARTRISQREAKQLRKRVVALEEERARDRASWSTGYVGGVTFARVIHHETAIQARLARKLNHAVVVTVDGDELAFHALPLAK